MAGVVAARYPRNQITSRDLILARNEKLHVRQPLARCMVVSFAHSLIHSLTHSVSHISNNQNQREEGLIRLITFTARLNISSRPYFCIGKGDAPNYQKWLPHDWICTTAEQRGMMLYGLYTKALILARSLSRQGTFLFPSSGNFAVHVPCASAMQILANAPRQDFIN